MLNNMKTLLLILLLPISILAQKVSIGGYAEVDSVSYRVKPARVTAYISDSALTTISATDTYYFLKGTFTNLHTASFTNDGDTLVYNNGDGRYLFIAYDFDVIHSDNNAIVTMGVDINGTICACSEKSQILRTSGEGYIISASFIVPVNNGDKIKLLIKSDKTGDVSALRGTATAFQIY